MEHFDTTMQTPKPPHAVGNAGGGGIGETGGGGEPASAIAGLSVLKGLVLYGATLAFGAFYSYFMIEILTAGNNKPPTFNGALVAAAAALAGVLGSAFALCVGVPTDAVNEDLQQAIATQRGPDRKGKTTRTTKLRRVLSLEPSAVGSASWPLTFGIWVYALIASAVALVYFLNQGETPDPLKSLAVAFAGYVLALVTAAYGLAAKKV